MRALASERPSSTRASRRWMRPELILSPLVLVVALAAWAFVTENRMVSAIVLPSPFAVGSGLVTLVTAPWFPQHFVTTALEMLAGFWLASLSAFATGVI